MSTPFDNASSRGLIIRIEDTQFPRQSVADIGRHWKVERAAPFDINQTLRNLRADCKDCYAQLPKRFCVEPSPGFVAAGTDATRLSSGGVADEWVTQFLRRGCQGVQEAFADVTADETGGIAQVHHGSATVVLVRFRFVPRRGVRRVGKWFTINEEAHAGA